MHTTQTFNIYVAKHSYFSYTSTCNSTPHNSDINHNTHHTPTQNSLKNTIFNNALYSPNIPTDPHTVTTIDIKANLMQYKLYLPPAIFFWGGGVKPVMYTHWTASIAAHKGADCIYLIQCSMYLPDSAQTVSTPVNVWRQNRLLP